MDPIAGPLENVQSVHDKCCRQRALVVTLVKRSTARGSGSAVQHACDFTGHVENGGEYSARAFSANNADGTAVIERVNLERLLDALITAQRRFVFLWLRCDARRRQRPPAGHLRPPERVVVGLGNLLCRRRNRVFSRRGVPRLGLADDLSEVSLELSNFSGAVKQ